MLSARERADIFPPPLRFGEGRPPLPGHASPTGGEKIVATGVATNIPALQNGAERTLNHPAA
jgi:hypothetical protein